MINSSDPNTRCYDVLKNVDEAVRDVIPDNIPYFVLGGVATGALEAELTEIDQCSSLVYAAEGSDKTIFRDAGSRRDIDILVLDTLPPEKFAQLDARVTFAVSGALLVSSFGIKPHQNQHGRGDRLKEAAKRFVSERTRDESGQDYYEMFPLIQPVRAESYMPYGLVTPQGYKVDVLHPVGHELAYRMRSIGGPRNKDAEKMQKVHEQLKQKTDYAELTEGDGVYSEWKLFADFIEFMRIGALPINHPNISPDSKKSDQFAFRTKARALHWLESQEKIVDFALHGPMQKVLNIFVGAGK